MVVLSILMPREESWALRQAPDSFPEATLASRRALEEVRNCVPIISVIGQLKCTGWKWLWLSNFNQGRTKRTFGEHVDGKESPYQEKLHTDH